MISRARRSIANIAFATDIDRLLSRIIAPKGIILALHRLRMNVDADALTGLNIDLEEFNACLDLLGSAGFEVVSMQEAMARVDRKSTDGKFAVLTFDDGYKDNYSLLLPELIRRQIPAQIYLTTGFIDRTAPMWWYGIDLLLKKHGAVVFNGEEINDFAILNDKIVSTDTNDLMRLLSVVEKRYDIDFLDFTDHHAMDWPMVREMAESGFVDIGSHGVSHMSLSRLTAEQARREMQISAGRTADEIGRPVKHFAYPYGDRDNVSRREVALARECGFATAATAIGGLVRSNRVNRHALRRVVLGGSGMVARLRASLAGMTGSAPLDGPR